MKKIVIAIDGPAASGKSTTAKLVAERLGYIHIDTGAMYRAMTLKILERAVSVMDRNLVGSIAENSEVRLENRNGKLVILLDGNDVSKKIRTPEVTSHVSLVSSYPEVRKVLVREQRKMSLEGGVVLEGRDIGTVVLPDADLKIFMVASIAERAKRRMTELHSSGFPVSSEELEREIEERDRKDASRETSPLSRAEDAFELDTTTLSIAQQVEFIVERARKLIGDVG